MTIALLVLTLQELIQFLKFYATVFPEQKNTYDIIDQAVKNNVSKNTPFYYALFNPDAQVFRWLLVVYKKAGKGHLLCQRNSFSEDIFDKAAFGVYTGNNPCLSFSLTEEGRNKLNEFITFFDNQRANPEVIDYLFQRSTLTKCVASSMEKPNRPKEALNTWGKYKYDPQYSFYQNILQNGLINRTHLPGINGFSLIAICYASLWLNWPNPKDKEIIQQLQVTFIKILTNMQTYPQDLQQEKISPTLIDYVKTGCLIDDLPRIDLCQHAQNYPIQKNAQVNSSFSQFILSIFRQYGYIDKKLELSPEQQHQWKDGIPLDKPLKQPFLGLLEHTYNPPNN